MTVLCEADGDTLTTKPEGPRGPARKECTALDFMGIHPNLADAASGDNKKIDDLLEIATARVAAFRVKHPYGSPIMTGLLTERQVDMS